MTINPADSLEGVEEVEVRKRSQEKLSQGARAEHFGDRNEMNSGCDND